MSAALRCSACGWRPGAPAVDPYPFRCPNSGSDDGDHVVIVDLAGAPAEVEPGPSCNPFVRYRSRLYSWHVARENGLSDADYVSIVEGLDQCTARVAGRGFGVTPFGRADALSALLGFGPEGGVWVKDETGSVSGSHKARHLMGVAVYLRVIERLGFGDPARPCAVASCGNAALAAAVVARAMGRRLLVFVPAHARQAVVTQLDALGATVTRCARTDRAPGDPCLAPFHAAVADGALPFSCQGHENGLVIEGASTLAYEMVDACGVGLPGRFFIQVGGGALASACAQGFTTAARFGWLPSVPRIHAVQTLGGHPLKRAYERFVEHLFGRMAAALPVVRGNFAGDGDRARHLARNASAGLLDEALAFARAHRSAFMWPWEEEPRSVATGILDDETYDWAALVEAMLRTSGFPVVVDEETLEEARATARRSTGIDVDHTGAAGLAGLIASTRSLDRPASSERVAVLFTGTTR